MKRILNGLPGNINYQVRLLTKINMQVNCYLAEVAMVRNSGCEGSYLLAYASGSLRHPAMHYSPCVNKGIRSSFTHFLTNLLSRYAAFNSTLLKHKITKSKKITNLTLRH